MRRIFARTRLEAPFLGSERGALWLSRDLRGAGGDTGLGDGPRRSSRTFQGTLHHPDLTDVALTAIRAERVAFSAPKLTGSTWTRSQLQGSVVEGGDATNSTWDVVDLTGVRIQDLAARGARFSLCSFRDADLSACDFTGATFVLCDFTGAKLSNLDLNDARFVGCEVEDAQLRSVDLSGADLGGTSFQRALFADCTLDGVVAAGADFRGALGVTPPAGARSGGGGLLSLWARLLGDHDRALKATSATWAALAIALPLLFFGRAILWPVNPDEAPGEEPHHEEPEEPQEQ